MSKINAKATLRYLISLLLRCLNELKEVGSDDDQFAYGEKTAYVECLECIQEIWEEAKENGLDFEIEEKYPL